MNTAIARDYYALLCGTPKKYKICGVFASKKEAQELAKEVKGCHERHLIKKVSVGVRWK